MLIKFFRRFPILSACLSAVLIFGLMAADTYTVPFGSVLGYNPPSKNTWANAMPQAKGYYLSNIAPYDWVGQRLGGLRSVVSDTTTTAQTINAWETGTVYSNTTASSDDKLTFNLPAAVVGLRFTFIKGDSVGSSVLWLQAGTGDTINAGTASKAYKCTGTTQPQAAEIYCNIAGKWAVKNQVGTWANDNS